MKLLVARTLDCECDSQSSSYFASVQVNKLASYLVSDFLTAYQHKKAIIFYSFFGMKLGTTRLIVLIGRSIGLV